MSTNNNQTDISEQTDDPLSPTYNQPAATLHDAAQAQAESTVAATLHDAAQAQSESTVAATLHDAAQAQSESTVASNLLDFATLDFEREERCGFPEVIFGLGKTPAQTAAIMSALAAENEVVLCTRTTREAADATLALLPDAVFVESCSILYYDRREGNVRIQGTSTSEILKRPGGSGNVLVCCAGTSDLSVTEEAALTARIMGSHVTMISDIGIAGVHRTLKHVDTMRSATVIVVVAGMEGALPSLVGGLVDVPVIAVPTSVGYGANFGGLAALLGMLNSCANGVSVVNIDNGFGAGVIAHRINAPTWLDNSSTQKS